MIVVSFWVAIPSFQTFDKQQDQDKGKDEVEDFEVVGIMGGAIFLPQRALRATE